MGAVQGNGTPKFYGRTVEESSPPAWPALPRAPKGAPNILLIMTDDVGFGSSSTFGGPVPTTTFDQLAAGGLRYNQFNTAAICSPTRAALLTGRNPQEVGVGYVTNWPTGYDGYNSVIPKSAGTVAQIQVGQTVIQSYTAAPAASAGVNHAPTAGSASVDTKAAGAAFDKSLSEALTAASYPAKADPAKINTVMTVLLLTILVIYVTLVYAPIAAMLVELFPTRIRYTSMSLPYHIGNGWFGGFLPTTSFAIVAATGDIYSGLWYPIVIAAATLVIGLIFVRETKDVDIYARD